MASILFIGGSGQISLPCVEQSLAAGHTVTVFNRGKAADLGFSYVISTGNEAGLTMADFLDYMIEDPRTNAVLLFCETVRDGPGFVAALEKARRRSKPIIAIKVGRSDAGTRASAAAGACSRHTRATAL